MLFHLVILFSSFCVSISAHKPSISFITLEQCIEKKYPVQKLLQEFTAAGASNQFVLSLKKGIIINEGGVITPQGQVFQDTQTCSLSRDQHRLVGTTKTIPEPLLFFKGSLAVISSPGQENWYHWLFQVLGRLKILADSAVHYDKIYINNLRYEWQKESLFVVMKKLAISQDKLLLIDEDTVIQADMLIVPSVPFIPVKDRKVFPCWLKQFIHECFLQNEAKGYCPSKIYISRNKARVRKIDNEQAFSQLLDRLGFVTIYLEDLSVFEQARLFHNATIIVGPHGSGFTNLIFSKPNTKVIELDHEIPAGDGQRSFYKRMCEIMDCSYYPFYTDLECNDELDKNLTVDLEKFTWFYEQIVRPSDDVDKKGKKYV